MCEVHTSVMNAVVVAVVDEYPDNMYVCHSDCMCNSGWCVGSSTVQYPLHISALAARNGNRTVGTIIETPCSVWGTPLMFPTICNLCTDDFASPAS